tara:strand:+ start:538 stop:1179 length:642 start_codon:yes stop_codon:yes gene_type:complete
MFNNILYSINSGLQLSIFTFMFSVILDFTISYNTLLDILRKTPELYMKGIRANIINLFMLSPIYYSVLYLLFLDDKNINLDITKLSMLILTHNFFYYIFHKAMHKIKYLNNFHDFHHKFLVTVPSTGNAVSISEYNFAYVLPFILGIIFLRPNNITLKMGVFLISFFNTLIHCKELHNLNWPEFLVSPEKHGVHHKNKTGTYSAPIFDLDKLF